MVNTQLKILRVFGPTGAEVSSVLRGIRDDGCPGLRLLERDGEFAICVQVSAPNRAMAEQYCDKWAARLRAKFGDDVFAEGETSLAQATLDALLEKLAEEGKNASFIALYYGEDVSEADAQAAGAKFQAICPDAEISVLSGGQPVYYYIISFE